MIDVNARDGDVGVNAEMTFYEIEGDELGTCNAQFTFCLNFVSLHALCIIAYDIRFKK